MQRCDLDLLLGHDRDDLLREHVERVARNPRLLDLALAHRLRDDGRLEQVGAELGEDAPLRGRAQLVPRAADALQAARHRLRALDLDHEVDRAHVDPELEARRRDEAGDPPRLQVLLDQHALLARERAVMGAGDFLFCGLVQPHREPLGEPAVVDEDDRRAMLLDELEDGGIDRRPDRPAFTGLTHVVERDDDLEVEVLARSGIDELDRTVARDEAADLLERTLRRREADPLRRPLEQRIEALERDRHVRTALRARDRVHLVEDHGLDPAQRLPRLGGQHQEERLGRRDQDVGRLLHQLAPFLLRRVARADADSELGLDPRERATQVPLDVVVERLQRRDVEKAQPGAGRAVELVDPVEEGGERLPGAGRRLDQDVAAGGDRGPAGRLRRRRAGKRALEPAPRLLGEGREWVHAPSLARLTRLTGSCSFGHMARGKPLTRFLLALCHSPDLLREFNDPGRRTSLLEEWRVGGNELFSGPLTQERVQAAVAAEQGDDCSSVEVAWWIWFFGGPPKKPDWVWGTDVEPEDCNGDNNGDDGDDEDEHSSIVGGGGPSNTR